MLAIITIIVIIQSGGLGGWFPGVYLPEGQRSLLGMNSGPGEVSVSTGWWVPLTLTLGTYDCAQEVQSLAHTCGMLGEQSASGVQQCRWPRLWQPHKAVS